VINRKQPLIGGMKKLQRQRVRVLTVLKSLVHSRAPVPEPRNGGKVGLHAQLNNGTHSETYL
jgi:hypothetical protein